jgi:Tol biopolymer transport system component
VLPVTNLYYWDFSDDGVYIGIFSEQMGRMNVDTGELEMLDASLPDFNSETGSISGDGSRLAWADHSGMYVYDFNAGQLMTVISFGVGEYVASPHLSGDGNRILFLGNMDFGNNPDGSRELFIIDVSGANVRQLSDYPDPGPVKISPPLRAVNNDGTKAAFTERIGNQFGLFLWQDGIGSQFLTDSAGLPVIDQDGTTVAFISTADLVGENPNNYNQLFFYDVLTQSFHQVTHRTQFDLNDGFSISGDGRYFAVRILGGDNMLYRFDRDGNSCPLVEGSYEYPQLNENGDRILNYYTDLTLIEFGYTVPTLSAFGLGLLVLMLTCTGVFYLRLKRRMRITG